MYTLACIAIKHYHSGLPDRKAIRFRDFGTPRQYTSTVQILLPEKVAGYLLLHP